jgi:hypothetical protein
MPSVPTASLMLDRAAPARRRSYVFDHRGTAENLGSWGSIAAATARTVRASRSLAAITMRTAAMTKERF